MPYECVECGHVHGITDVIVEDSDVAHCPGCEQPTDAYLVDGDGSRVTVDWSELGED